ncbi:BON domain-containing protein [Cupriavidus lacunae]|uniref:BON domain-containing protein n=1 Tax=Cupriavidus lacunae TaxID=2666307 RepID=A0A370P1T4_9BURK|nr:BON domain-containing protein [Cupriavidus lacunae]RDK11745.1 BON domain-containing protein [Cupriavidus lacunae]
MKDYPPSEIRETWRNRGYGEPGDARHAHHWRSGNPGGSAFGYGQARYGMEGGEAPEDSYRPGQVPARPASRRLPRNYQRTDTRIRDDLCERLAHAGDDVSDVSVEVVSGIVTLSGTVSDRGIKYRIEEMAEDVLGVNAVRNNLHVARSAAGEGGRQRAFGAEGGAAPGERRIGQSAGRWQPVGVVASDVLYIVQSRDGRFLGAKAGEAVLVPLITQAGLFDDPDEARAAAQEHCSRGYRLLATRR